LVLKLAGAGSRRERKKESETRRVGIGLHIAVENCEEAHKKFHSNSV